MEQKKELKLKKARNTLKALLSGYYYRKTEVFMLRSARSYIALVLAEHSRAERRKTNGRAT